MALGRLCSVTRCVRRAQGAWAHERTLHAKLEVHGAERVVQHQDAVVKLRVVLQVSLQRVASLAGLLLPVRREGGSEVSTHKGGRTTPVYACVACSSTVALVGLPRSAANTSSAWCTAASSSMVILAGMSP